MDYSEVFLRQHDEMCQVVGSIVFSLVEAGHDSTSENIVAVLRNGIAESGKWEPNQVLYLGVRLENESMVTPVFATPILTISWLA
ncbi:DUF2767 family protein [Enterobacter soli]|uniref:Fumarase D n=1 Tax=Enterobacter soli TaxID=885040 RepID=A0AAW8HDJ7_9ENTR|nr:DUF2767 family protein [Enterobacter soli]MDQ2258913.1 DUF2767 family protein [Enterobacter soli]MDQ2339412.1 DUF2767 family protein [Enterobacter soli]